MSRTERSEEDYTEEEEEEELYSSSEPRLSDKDNNTLETEIEFVSSEEDLAAPSTEDSNEETSGEEHILHGNNNKQNLISILADEAQHDIVVAATTGIYMIDNQYVTNLTVVAPASFSFSFSFPQLKLSFSFSRDAVSHDVTRDMM
jgi:hypothetical protein